MRIKICNTTLIINFSFLAFLTLVLLIDKTGYILPCFLAVFMHEMGHLISMSVLKCAPNTIMLKVAAIEISGFKPKTYKDRFIIAFMGVCFNILLFFVFYFLYKVTLIYNMLIYAAANLAVGFINLLPSLGLDGGDLLLLTLNCFLSYNKSMFIVKFISIIVSVILISITFLKIINLSNNISILIFGIYLFISTLLTK